MAVTETRPALHAYLGMPAAAVVDVAEDGSALVTSNESGTDQLYELASGRPSLRRVSRREERISGLYVPGTRRLVAQTDTGGDECHQLYLLDLDSDELRDLVVEPGVVHNLAAVSRDGALVAYTSNRRNGVDFDVWVRELRTGEESCIYADGGMCFANEFSADGSRLAFTRPGPAPMDADILIADLRHRDVSVVTAHEEPAMAGEARWAPDGSLWFTTNAGRDFNAIARLAPGAPRWEYALESDCDLGFALSRDGRHLLAAESREGAHLLQLHDVVAMAPFADVALPEPAVTAATFSVDGSRLWITLTPATEPGDVYAFDLTSRAMRRVTRSPRDVAPETMAHPENHWIESFDGERLHVLLYRTARTAASRPAVVWVHGGPEGQSTVMFNPVVQYLVARGYTVAAPNVRGSTGYGKRFYGLDDVHRRLDSVRDLAAVHAWLGSSGVDPRRIALWGASYGGYMVLAGLAFQPELWAAGVDIVGISNLETFLENTSAYRRSHREREYGSLGRDRELLRAISPLTHADRISAPLFMIHGANDPRVPLSETQQIATDLRARGFECTSLVYSDEGHGLAKLRNRLDAYPQAIDFLDRALLG